MREDLTRHIQELGYWCSSDEVDAALNKIKKAAEKVKALKVQLKYRQLMIEQEAPKELFAFSAAVDGRRSVHSWTKLAENLKAIVALGEGYLPNWLMLLFIHNSQFEHCFFNSHNHIIGVICLNCHSSL
jgi:hypothetical protein